MRKHGAKSPSLTLWVEIKSTSPWRLPLRKLMGLSMQDWWRSASSVEIGSRLAKAAAIEIERRDQGH